MLTTFIIYWEDGHERRFHNRHYLDAEVAQLGMVLKDVRIDEGVESANVVKGKTILGRVEIR